jgi:TRAP-type mannitol/chloroaromatic compound transport system permease large subunit
MLSGLYIVYVAIRSYLQPHLAPAIPIEERNVPFSVKTILVLKTVAPTAVLVLSVLGVIYFGIAAPTEAAAIGALVATILTIFYKRFTWKVLKDVSMSTIKLTAMGPAHRELFHHLRQRVLERRRRQVRGKLHTRLHPEGSGPYSR